MNAVTSCLKFLLILILQILSVISPNLENFVHYQISMDVNTNLMHGKVLLFAKYERRVTDCWFFHCGQKIIFQRHFWSSTKRVTLLMMGKFDSMLKFDEWLDIFIIKGECKRASSKPNSAIQGEIWLFRRFIVIHILHWLHLHCCVISLSELWHHCIVLHPRTLTRPPLFNNNFAWFEETLHG